MNSVYQQILSKFPTKHIKFAFAYGSGVFEQLENAPPPKTASSNMIDFVFAVDDSVKFHDENLRRNPSHYSFLRHLGPYYISRLQDAVPAGVYYNTLVPLELDDSSTRLIKYGVVSEHALIRDLFDWDYLYMSGRLHKPVKIIKRPGATVSSFRFSANMSQNEFAKSEETSATNNEMLNFNFETFNKSIDLALQTNLQNALHTALLLMPEKFSLEQLFLCITEISYSGDLRMLIGENKQKCFNIVRPQTQRFTDLYKPYLIKESFEKYLECDFKTGQLQQCSNASTIYHHLNQLPKGLIHTIVRMKFRSSPHYDLEEIVYKLTNRIDYKEIIAKALSSIVKYASTVQSLKGVFTAGLFKTVNYSMRKLNKMRKK